MAEIDDPNEGLGGCTPRYIHKHIISRYSTIIRKMIADNKSIYNEGMGASRKLARYVRKQEYVKHLLQMRQSQSAKRA